jgi:hypothetical protein
MQQHAAFRLFLTALTVKQIKVQGHQADGCSPYRLLDDNGARRWASRAVVQGWLRYIGLGKPASRAAGDGAPVCHQNGRGGAPVIVAIRSLKSISGTGSRRSSRRRAAGAIANTPLRD